PGRREQRGYRPHQIISLLVARAEVRCSTGPPSSDCWAAGVGSANPQVALEAETGGPGPRVSSLTRMDQVHLFHPQVPIEPICMKCMGAPVRAVAPACDAPGGSRAP